MANISLLAVLALQRNIYMDFFFQGGFLASEEDSSILVTGVEGNVAVHHAFCIAS